MNKEVKVTCKNPFNEQTIDYFIKPYDKDLSYNWIHALEKILIKNLHLEKNFCFFCWPDDPRTIEILCDEANQAVQQINKFNASNGWTKHGLKSYHINDTFTRGAVQHSASEGIGEYKSKEKPGLQLKHDIMNRLHRYFEDLQGPSWRLSIYYDHADFETKYAIRQLNLTCHQLESRVTAEWTQAHNENWLSQSQVTTFLNAPRYNLKDHHYDDFLINRYDRQFGHVYMHWCQIGKTHIEVFRDEEGKNINEQICSTMNALKYYSGEFDLYWGHTETRKNFKPLTDEEIAFSKWLTKNGFDYNDKKLSLGYLPIAEINFEKSFGTTKYDTIWSIMSQHLDIFKIAVVDENKTIAECTYDYKWTDPDFKEKQMSTLIPGYEYHSNK
tara:strand:+ start:1900 stop:3054 length:1155 start_codon:yes stop_codon:yes gene_type:complete